MLGPAGGAVKDRSGGRRLLLDFAFLDGAPGGSPGREELSMRILVALGGNALLRRGEPMTADNQRRNVRIAAEALAPVAAEHQMGIAPGNGPQVGLLSLEAAAYTAEEDFPLDVMDAETEGSIGYMIEQELGNLLPFERPFASLLTMIEVDPGDPAFKNPTKFIGPVYDKAQADAIAAEKAWSFKADGNKW